LVPEVIRGDFTVAIRPAASGFRYHAFFIGGNEDEARRDVDLRTVRVRAWAAEFVRFLDGVGA